MINKLLLHHKNAFIFQITNLIEKTDKHRKIITVQKNAFQIENSHQIKIQNSIFIKINMESNRLAKL